MKNSVFDSRFDFRGGLVTAISPDLLNTNELVDSTNCQISEQYGSITGRKGSQRIHQNQLSSIFVGPFQYQTVNGLIQWDAPGVTGKQIVAICGGVLHYRNGYNFATNFTVVAAPALGVDGEAFLVPFRANTAGAPLILFIAHGGQLYTWTGAVLTNITGVAGAPQADRLAAYHTRLFATDIRFPKNVFWSKVGDGQTWTTGTKTDGGSAMVGVFSGEQLNSYEVIGSSLLLGSTTSISRFTGHASDDIVIAQDTEGISSELGSITGFSLRRYENYAGIFNERGLFEVNEQATRPLSEQVKPEFAKIDKTAWDGSSGGNGCGLGWNRETKELMLAVPLTTDGTRLSVYPSVGVNPPFFRLNQTVYIYSARLNCIYGPWKYPFSIACQARYVDVNGVESVIIGTDNGRVIQLNIGNLDDVLFDGTGGASVTSNVEFPVIQFGKPGFIKALKGLLLQGTFPSGSNVTIGTSFDGVAFDFTAVPLQGAQEASQRVDLDGQGYRLRMTMSWSTSAGVASPTINGFVLKAYDYNRISGF